MTAPRSHFAGAGFDFTAGEIYGLRGWSMDDYGRLRAMHLPGVKPWRPGINTAACYTPGGEASAVTIAGIPFPGPRVLVENEDAEHAAPDEQCHCGFYAYTDLGPATYGLGHGYVFGVIRGTGRTLIGTKGFRCEKAEILGVLDPLGERDVDSLSEWRRDRLRAVYPDVPMLSSRAELIEFAPVETTAPDPSTDDFWSLA